MSLLPVPSRSDHHLPDSYDRSPVLLQLLTSGRAIGFFAHAVAYTFTCLIVFVTAGVFPSVIVALSWGIGLVLHGLFALIVPLMGIARAEAFEPELPTLPPMAAEPLALPDRTRALEELSAAIAHEIRNPITAAKSLVQQIAEDPTARDTVEHARVAVEELDRVERSIAHLLRFAREEPFEPGSVDVRELIDSSIELLRDRAERQAVRVERDVEPLPALLADGEQLRKVLANLLGNALDAHAERPSPHAFIRISAGRNLAGNEVWIRVRDNGPGMSEDQRQQAFKPFSTNKPGGTGLGLALARKVMARHHGSIELVDAKPPGVELLLVLPLKAATGPGGTP